METSRQMNARLARERERAEQKERFLDSYAGYPHMGKAARHAGVAVRTVYRWVERDDEFAARFAAARREGVDGLVDVIADAVRGDIRVRQGYHAPDIRAAQWLAARIDPDRYGDRTKVESDQDITVRWEKRD